MDHQTTSKLRSSPGDVPVPTQRPSPTSPGALEEEVIRLGVGGGEEKEVVVVLVHQKCPEIETPQKLVCGTLIGCKAGCKDHRVNPDMAVATMANHGHDLGLNPKRDRVPLSSAGHSWSHSAVQQRLAARHWHTGLAGVRLGEIRNVCICLCVQSEVLHT